MNPAPSSDHMIERSHFVARHMNPRIEHGTVDYSRGTAIPCWAWYFPFLSA